MMLQQHNLVLGFSRKKNSMELKLCFSCSKFGELLLYELLTEIKLVEL